MASDDQDNEREKRRAESDRINQQVAIDQGKILHGTLVEIGNTFLDVNNPRRMNVERVVTLLLIQSQISLNHGKYCHHVFGPRPERALPTGAVPTRVEIVRIPLPELEEGQEQKTPQRPGPPEMAGTPPPRKSGPIMLGEAPAVPPPRADEGVSSLAGASAEAVAPAEGAEMSAPRHTASVPGDEPRHVAAELTTDRPRQRSLVEIRLDRIRGNIPKEPNQ